MRREELLDRAYAQLGRSRLVVRAAVHARGIASAVIAKRLAPSTLAERNGEYALLDRLGEDVRVVVDVGANVGEWSEHALARWPEAERVICFEPGEAAARELARRLGSDPRVTIVERALSDSEEDITFWEEPSAGTMSSAAAGHSAPSAIPRTVRTATLDAELARLGIAHVDLLKIDAEGFDLHVLRGAARLLGELAVDVVQFEYSLGWQAAESTLRGAFALLAQAGYETWLVVPEGLRSFDPDATSELYTYANFVAIAPGARGGLRPGGPAW